MNHLNLSVSEQVSVLQGLRAKRRAEAASMAPSLGLSFVSRLHTLGLHAEAEQVEAMVKRIYQMEGDFPRQEW